MIVKEKLQEKIVVYCTANEKEKMISKSKESNKSLSEYVKEKCLKSKNKSNAAMIKMTVEIMEGLNKIIRILDDEKTTNCKDKSELLIREIITDMEESMSVKVSNTKRKC